MCQGKPEGAPKNLHEKICAATHGAPCKAAHAIGSLFNMIIGRPPNTIAAAAPTRKIAATAKTPKPDHSEGNSPCC